MRGEERFALDADFLESYRREGNVPRHVAVVGAGRWAKVLVKVLGEFAPRLSTIHLVAERNYRETLRWIADSSNGHGSRDDRVVVIPSLREILTRDEIEVAIGAKMASEHYVATRELLMAGKHVLVEKPLVLHADQARHLVELAREKNRALAVGYEFMFAPPLHRLKENIDRRLDEVKRVDFYWADISGAVKWGVRKERDWSANVVTDSYPHVLSQLHLLFGHQDIALRRVTSRDGCWQAAIDLDYGPIAVTANLDKEAARARRTISVSSRSGRSLLADFAEEPGSLKLDGEEIVEEGATPALPRSLTSQIAYFFAQTRTLDESLPNAADKTAHFVAATERANEMLLAKQMELVRPLLWGEYPASLGEDVSKILRHHAVDPLLASGLVSNPKDTASIDLWASRMFRIAHRFSLDPWTTQETILAEEGLSKEELLSLNAALRDSGFYQDLIVREGIAKKYWETVLPLTQSGSIHSVLTNGYQFPLRVGIYAAVSCMFYCSFCGRNTAVRYAGKDIAPGNEMFDAVFAAMPAGISTLSLGGGLEPLTNPKLDNVIASAKRHGHRVPLVTNGYMLTPGFVRKHRGLWDLDVFRISCYGVDEDSYVEVTQRRGAFALVKENIIEFLKERNRRQSPLKVGLNFIVLVNTIDRVLRLLDLVIEIREAVGGPGIDFLTLREDFSVPETEGLTACERASLVEIFAEFNKRRARQCPDLKVDFGYALYPLSQGIVSKPLAMVTHEGMLPRAYPQVSVAIDILGDVYLYRDAAFLERPGADRYIIGRVTKERSLEQVVREFLESGREIPPYPDDPALMDAFDHVVTLLIQQAKADEAVGIPFNLGPIQDRRYEPKDEEAAVNAQVVNYWQSLFKL